MSLSITFCFSASVILDQLAISSRVLPHPIHTEFARQHLLMHGLATEDFIQLPLVLIPFDLSRPIGGSDHQCRVRIYWIHVSIRRDGRVVNHHKLPSSEIHLGKCCLLTLAPNAIVSGDKCNLTIVNRLSSSLRQPDWLGRYWLDAAKAGDDQYG